MIPQFPQFKPVALEDKVHIEAFTHKHAPYSDYNFMSLWSWDTQERISVSVLNENLVVRFDDYVTGEPFFSFIGTNKVRETIDTLLTYARTRGVQESLRLIPHIVVEHIGEDQTHWHVEEDEDNHDYVLSIPEIAQLEGKKYAMHRNLIRRFQRNNPNHAVRDLDITDPLVRKQIEQLIFTWAETKSVDREELEQEFQAIRRHMLLGDIYQLVALGVFVEDKLVSFSTSEVVHPEYVAAHFRKADRRYAGLYQFQEHELAKRLHAMGCLYKNYEQDLGLEGLRHAKHAWNPVHFLKKYIIRPGKKDE